MKFYVTTLLLNFVCIFTLAQQPVVIKAQPGSNHVYETTFRGYIKYKIIIRGKSPVVNIQLEAAGINLPIEATELTTIKWIATTGAPDMKGQIPLTLKYTQSSLQRETNEVHDDSDDNDYINNLRGQMAKGLVTAKGKVQLDSATDMRITESDINRLDLINIFKLPTGSGQAIKAGDSYIVKDNNVKLIDILPVKPIAQRKSTYKLVEIKDGKAYFDIVNEITGSFNAGKFTGLVKGNGTGNMVFDIEKSMPSVYSNSINTVITIPITQDDAMEISYQSVSNNYVKIN